MPAPALTRPRPAPARNAGARTTPPPRAARARGSIRPAGTSRFSRV